MNWRCCALLFFLLATAPAGVYADEAASSPEAQRFEEAKRLRQRSLAAIYIRTAKGTVEKAWQDWHPPASGKLLITKVKMTVDASGKMSACKVVAGSGSDQEDKSVCDCLSGAFFQPLPIGFPSLDLFWTLMSDGTMNMVENTDSAEANAYNTNLIGASLAPNGRGINVPRFGFSTISVGASAIGGGSAAANGPYMADLQRRIKRAWFPPKGGESKRLVVVFKVHRGGDITDLRLDHSSGVALADQAALQAVKNAAPFRPLPAGCKDIEDIQFTFDYNVFSGGGHGTFRSF